MTQGEFTGLSEHIKQRFEYYCHHPEGIAFSGEMLKPSHVIMIFSKVLEEAKREFPPFEVIGTSTESIVISCYKRWFEKWLGKEEAPYINTT